MRRGIVDKYKRNSPVRAGRDLLSRYWTTLPETKALVSAMMVKPSSTQQANIGRFIDTLKKGAVWSYLDFLSVPCFSHNTNGEALLWWTDPTKTMSLFGSTFVKNGGLKSDGISQYFKTGYNPTGSSKYGLNDASFGLFYTGALVDNATLMGMYNGVNSRCEIDWHSTGSNSHFIGENVITKATVSSELEGFQILSRLNATQRTLSKNTINETITANSLSVPNLEFYGACRNLQGTGAHGFSSPLIGMMFAGKGLTQAKVDILKNAFIVYLSNLNDPLFNNFIALGDSITLGFGTTSQATKRYSKLVSTTKSVREINKGYSGQAIQAVIYDHLSDFNYYDRNAKVIVAGGTNDIGLEIAGTGTRAAFQTKYGQLLDGLKGLGYPFSKIICANIAWCIHERAPYIPAYNAIIAEEAAKRNITVVDFYNTTLNHAEYLYTDNIHINDAGHVALAAAINAVV